jgi:hypothetical protein
MKVPVSELIALGRTLRVPAHGQRHSKDNVHGCALGMAEAALGLSYEDPDHTEDGVEVAQLEEVHPWLKRNVSISDYPCQCPSIRAESWSSSLKKDYADIITHLFDYHVCHKSNPRLNFHEPWTLDQIIDWVHVVEPKPRNIKAKAKDLDRSAVEVLHFK